MTRRIIPLIAVFAAACSTPQTVTLSNGVKALWIHCYEAERCDQYALKTCRRVDYHVYERAKHQPAVEASDQRQRWAGARNAGESGLGAKALSEEELQPYWRLVFDCNPSTDQLSSRLVIKEDMAAFERNKARYMREVCALRDPENLREELEIARQQYGNVTCDD